MAPFDLLGLGLLGIRTRKLRAALSALGISIGIATLIVVTSIPASSQRSLFNQLTALGTNMLQVSYDPNAKPAVVLPPESVAMVSRIGPVTIASAVANLNLPVERSDKIPATYATGLTTLATQLNLLPAVNGTMASGTFLTAATERFPVAVLGATAANRLGFPEVLTGRTPPLIFVGKTWFSVAGILKPVPLHPDLDTSVLVGWDIAATELGFHRSPTVIYVKAPDDEIDAVHAVLPATVNPRLPGVVRVSNPSSVLAAKQATRTTFSALFLGLAAVALLVGGIGVANTMYISILERRREIGLRRALGANRGQIRAQFLTESAVLSGVGGAAGTLIGVAASFAYCAYQGWPTVIPPAALAAGLLGAVLIGMIAGAYPSVRASRLTPTQALSAT
ncbi:ABC transporter permease [Streptomyces sp. NPDC088197]|uniref:ABC transporter permease n=1 Tax=Streptomyces sp. NPDC088197 TaxID=3365840 RepID=UPI00381905D4